MCNECLRFPISYRTLCQNGIMLGWASVLHYYTHFSHCLFLSFLTSQTFFGSWMQDVSLVAFCQYKFIPLFSDFVFLFTLILSLSDKGPPLISFPSLEYPPILRSITQGGKKNGACRRGGLERRGRGMEKLKRVEGRLRHFNVN